MFMPKIQSMSIDACLLLHGHTKHVRREMHVLLEVSSLISIEHLQVDFNNETNSSRCGEEAKIQYAVLEARGPTLQVNLEIMIKRTLATGSLKQVARATLLGLWQ